MTQYQTPDTTEIQAESQEIMERSKAMQVVTHAEYALAGEELKRVKGAMKKVDSLFAESIDSADKALKAIKAAKKKVRDPLEFLEANLKNKTTNFLIAERKREAEEAIRLRREAEERARQEMEAARKRDEEERLAAAQMLEAQGFKDEANDLISQESNPVIIQPVIMKPVSMAPKIEGVHLVTTFSAEVTNLMALVKAVAAGNAPLACLTPDQKFLNNQARALRHELRFEGVKVIESHNTASRSSFA